MHRVPVFIFAFSISLFPYKEAPEAVKRKAEDSVDAPAEAEAVCPTPEKKSKLEESATENGAAEEVAA